MTCRVNLGMPRATTHYGPNLTIPVTRDEHVQDVLDAYAQNTMGLTQDELWTIRNRTTASLFAQWSGFCRMKKSCNPMHQAMFSDGLGCAPQNFKLLSCTLK